MDVQAIALLVLAFVLVALLLWGITVSVRSGRLRIGRGPVLPGSEEAAGQRRAYEERSDASFYHHSGMPPTLPPER